MSIKRVSFDDLKDSNYNDNIIYHINFHNSIIQKHESNRIVEHEPTLKVKLVPDINFKKVLDIINFTVEKKLNVKRVKTVNDEPLRNEQYYKVLLPAMTFTVHDTDIHLGSEIYHCHNKAELARAIHQHLTAFFNKIRLKNIDLKKSAIQSPKRYEEKELSNFLLIAYDICKNRSIENIHFLNRIESILEDSFHHPSNSFTIDIMDTTLDDYVMVVNDRSYSKQSRISNIVPFQIQENKLVFIEVEPNKYHLAYHYHDLEHIRELYYAKNAGLQPKRSIYDDGFDNCIIAFNDDFEKRANSSTGYMEMSGRYIIFANKELARQYIMMQGLRDNLS